MGKFAQGGKAFRRLSGRKMTMSDLLQGECKTKSLERDFSKDCSGSAAPHRALP